MIIKNCRFLVDSHDCFLLSKGSSFLISNFRYPNICSSRSLSTSYKTNLDDLLLLSDPLLVVPTRILQGSSSVSSLDERNDSNLMELSLKPILKVDKKIKKNDKDDDKDIEKLKLKVKKKVRSKVNFDEDYESVNELFENSDALLENSSLPLARPSKPVSLTVNTNNSLPKYKLALASKKKISTSSQKKVFNSDVDLKPEKVSLKGSLTVQALSDLFKVSTTDIIKSLFLKGVPVTVNQLIDSSVAKRLAEDFGILVDTGVESSLDQVDSREDFNKNVRGSELRSPIVTIMGHVDHGKTTLLDKIRKTQVAQKEAGGITQKIGAYEVSVVINNQNKKIIFLDTPGHEAFSGMRSRGVSITDIVILVVAADDGVKPQTIEAIKCAQSYNVPIIVAINKIDKENADVETIKRELSQFNLIAEDWGGDTLMVPISAIQETNLDNLLEMIILLADVLNLTADPSCPAEGVILESHLDRTRGPIASVLIQNGTLRVGDTVTFSNQIGKVRGMINSTSETTKKAGPSSPVVIWGLSTVPSIGERIFSFKDEKEAKSFIASKNNLLRSNLSSLQLFTEISYNSNVETKKKLNLIIKTDSQGSAEAINSSLTKLNTFDVQIRILYSSAGEVTETDVEFASTSNATIVAFNTTSASGAKKLAKSSSVVVQEFNVVYDLFDYIQVLIDDIVGPQYDEKMIGRASVKTVFPLAKSFVAGSLILEGKVINNSVVQVLRNNEIVYKGPITSLKRLKENVEEVSSGLECGIFINEFDTWKPEDVIIIFEMVPKKKNTF